VRRQGADVDALMFRQNLDAIHSCPTACVWEILDHGWPDRGARWVRCRCASVQVEFGWMPHSMVFH
jgi:hypothetical protein